VYKDLTYQKLQLDVIEKATTLSIAARYAAHTKEEFEKAIKELNKYERSKCEPEQ